MREFPKWYEVYLTIWFLLALLGVTWQATKGDLGPFRQLALEALLAGAICAVFALVARLRGKPQ